jgi:hypothetical protein
LNPENWLLVGEDVNTPVSDGLLARWDTSRLDGLFTLRLMVVYEQNRVEQSLVQVTLDNTPPQVLVLYPQAGQVISLDEEPQIPILVQVEEAYQSQVVIYVDGRQVGSISSAPFGVLWQAEAGAHVVVVTATDRTGNTGTTEIRFTVR